jgi:hypothetical protein
MVPIEVKSMTETHVGKAQITFSEKMLKRGLIEGAEVALFQGVRLYEHRWPKVITI